MKYSLITLLLLALGCSQPDQEKQTSSTNEENMVSQTLSIVTGTYTNKGTSQGLYHLQFDPATGQLVNDGLMAESTDPSFVAQSADGGLVYVANETEVGEVTAYKRNGNKLELINKVGTQGMHPCYVSVSPSGSLVAVANYSSGDVSLFGVNEDGSLKNEPQLLKHEGSGPNKDRQEGPHAHFSNFSADGRFLYAVDLGIDQVMVYAIDEGVAGEGKTALQLEPGDGPRHLVFHPTQNLVYVVNELSNVVVSATIDSETGVFTQIDRQSTLPQDFTGTSYTADIHISNNGQWLYVSNRGHHSITLFHVKNDGTIEFKGTTSGEGEWPRNFNLTPDNKHLIVANEHTSNVVVFDVNQEDGSLTFTGNQVEVPVPVCLSF